MLALGHPDRRRRLAVVGEADLAFAGRVLGARGRSGTSRPVERRSGTWPARLLGTGEPASTDGRPARSRIIEAVRVSTSAFSNSIVTVALGEQRVVGVVVQRLVERAELLGDRRCEAGDQEDDDADDVRHEEDPEQRTAETHGEAALMPRSRAFACNGTRPATIVPRLGADVMSSAPPSAATRSTMLPEPDPGRHSSGSKPDPSSRTENTSWPACSSSRTTTFDPGACFAALFSASRQAK